MPACSLHRVSAYAHSRCHASAYASTLRSMSDVAMMAIVKITRSLPVSLTPSLGYTLCYWLVSPPVPPPYDQMGLGAWSHFNRWWLGAHLYQYSSINTQLSMACATQECNFKLLSLWYLTSSKLHPIFLSHLDSCLHCSSPPGTLIHIWWACLLIWHLWNRSFASITYTCSVISTQLSWISPPYPLTQIVVWSQIFSSSFFLFLPTFLEWLEILDDVMCIGELVAMHNDTYEKFNWVWLALTMFKDSSQFSVFVVDPRWLLPFLPSLSIPTQQFDWSFGCAY